MIRRIDSKMPTIYKNPNTIVHRIPDITSWKVAYGFLMWHKFSNKQKVDYCLKQPKWFLKSMAASLLRKIGWRFNNPYSKTHDKGYTMIRYFF